jgi:phosphatidylglycerol:prolipoprotein diacylglycerol transferase
MARSIKHLDPPDRVRRRPDGARSAPTAMEAALLQEAVTATCWFQPPRADGPSAVSIRFRGASVSARETFDYVERIDGIVAGSGPIAVTGRALTDHPGRWAVRAEAVPEEGPAHRLAAAPAPPRARPGSPRRWLWTKGNPLALGGTGGPSTTRLAAFATAPGIVPGAWAGCVALGAAIAFVLQAFVGTRLGVPAGAGLTVSAVAILVGAVGAKVWFLALHGHSAGAVPSQGLCIQGFVVGATLVELLGARVTRVPTGALLDAIAPGLLLAMAVGRQGCFLSGCCAGRINGSRWAVWASDGRVGARRVPTQHLEALACAALGAVALVVNVEHVAVPRGSVFVGAMAAYTVGRQLVLPFRAEARRTPAGARAALVVAAAALVIDVAVAAMARG